MPTLSELLAMQASTGVQQGMNNAIKTRNDQQALQFNAQNDQAAAALLAEAKQRQLNDAPRLAGETEAAKTAADLASFMKVKETNPNISGVGSIHEKVIDPMALEIRSKAADAKNAIRINKDLGDRVGKLTNEYDGSLDVYETMRDIVKNPNAVSKGHIKTLLARIEAGKFKPFQSTLDYAGGPKTFSEIAQDKINLITGDDAALIPPNQLTDLVDTMSKHLKPQVDTYNQRATDLKGYGVTQGAKLTPEERAALLDNPLSAREKRFTDVNSSLNDYLAKHPRNAQSAPTNVLQQLSANMMGSKPASAAPDYRAAALAEIAKRKGGT